MRYDEIKRLARNPIYARLKEMKTNPEMIDLHINDACNMNCSYCYSSERKVSKIDFGKVISDAKSLSTKTITFLGGEPLLDPNLKRYLKLCEKEGLNATVFTNGALMTRGYIRFFKGLKNNLTVSIKFSDREFYERYTSRHIPFDMILKNIQLCRDAGIRVILFVTISMNNYLRTSEIIVLVEKIGVKAVFERYIPIGSAVDNELELGADEWSLASGMIRDYVSLKQMSLISIGKSGVCSCYFDKISIDINGNVKPCPMATDEQIIGNITKDSLKDIWDEFIRRRKESWMRVPDECKLCKDWSLCHGGCRTYTFIKHKRYDMKDPLCDGKTIPTLGLCGFSFK